MMRSLRRTTVQRRSPKRFLRPRGRSRLSASLHGSESPFTYVLVPLNITSLGRWAVSSFVNMNTGEQRQLEMFNFTAEIKLHKIREEFTSL